MLQRKQTDADEALRGAQREAQRAQELQVQLFVFFLVFLSFFLVVVVVVVVVVVFVVVVVVMEQLFIPFAVFLLMTRSTLRLPPGLSLLLLLLSWNSSSFPFCRLPTSSSSVPGREAGGFALTVFCFSLRRRDCSATCRRRARRTRTRRSASPRWRSATSTPSASRRRCATSTSGWNRSCATRTPSSR